MLKKWNVSYNIHPNFPLAMQADLCFLFNNRGTGRALSFHLPGTSAVGLGSGSMKSEMGNTNRRFSHIRSERPLLLAIDAARHPNPVKIRNKISFETAKPNMACPPHCLHLQHMALPNLQRARGQGHILKSMVVLYSDRDHSRMPEYATSLLPECVAHSVILKF